MKNNRQAESGRKGAPEFGRKQYTKPAIVHREIVESIAGGCESTHPVNGKTGSGDTCTMIGS